MAEENSKVATFAEEDNDVKTLGEMERQASWIQVMQDETYEAGYVKTLAGLISAWVLVAAFTVCYLAIFSRMDLDFVGSGTFIGYGDIVFVALRGRVDIALYCAALSIGGYITLYVLDVYNWKGRIQGPLGKLLLLICLGAFFVAVLLAAESYPSAPLLAFMLFTSLTVAFVKRVIYPDVSKTVWLSALCGAMFTCSMGVGILWLVWVLAEDRYWDTEVKLEYYELLDCANTFEFNNTGNSTVVTFGDILKDEDLKKVFEDAGAVFAEDCDSAYIVWIAPLIFFIVGLALAMTTWFLLRAEIKRIETKQAVPIEPLAQVFITLITLSILGMWVAASIASATSAVSDTILSLSFLALLMMVALAVGVFGIKYLRDQVKTTAIGQKLFQFGTSDWGKGFATVVGGPLFIIYMMLDTVTQAIRKYTCIGASIEDEDESNSIFTKTTRSWIDKMKLWNWSSVSTKALVWGMFYFTVSVGVARIVLVFLSYLREALDPVSIGVTTAILLVVGLIMFLLPPVPGVPVYILTGILIVSKAEDQMTFGGALMYAIGLSFGMKMTAIFLQQKVIGEKFGSKYVSIRSMVGINSLEMRAIRSILSVDGFSFGKVAILIGGPDWPTSVLTGIMRLRYTQMALGSVPVIFLIAPCCVTGALLVKSGTDGGIFESLTSLSITLTVIVQSASMLVAAQVIAATSVKKIKELNEIEIDQEVVQYEAAKKEKAELSKNISHWDNITNTMRFGHIIAVTLMSGACYAFQLIGSSLFETFDIVNSIDEDLDGNVFNLVKPLGWIVLAVFAVSCVWYSIFWNMMKRKVAVEYKKTLPEDDVVESTVE